MNWDRGSITLRAAAANPAEVAAQLSTDLADHQRNVLTAYAKKWHLDAPTSLEAAQAIVQYALSSSETVNQLLEYGARVTIEISKFREIYIDAPSPIRVVLWAMALTVGMRPALHDISIAEAARAAKVSAAAIAHSRATAAAHKAATAAEHEFAEASAAASAAADAAAAAKAAAMEALAAHDDNIVADAAAAASDAGGRPTQLLWDVDPRSNSVTGYGTHEISDEMRTMEENKEFVAWVREWAEYADNVVGEGLRASVTHGLHTAYKLIVKAAGIMNSFVPPPPAVMKMAEDARDMVLRATETLAQTLIDTEDAAAGTPPLTFPWMVVQLLDKAQVILQEADHAFHAYLRSMKKDDAAYLPFMKDDDDYERPAVAGGGRRRSRRFERRHAKDASQHLPAVERRWAAAMRGRK